MTRVLVVMAAVALSAGGTTFAREPQPGGPAMSADVKIVDNVVYEAVAARDAKQLDAILDDGFMLTNTFGTLYMKKDFLKGCCEGPAASETQYLGAKQSEVKKYGETTAVIVSDTEHRFKKDGQDQKVGWRSLRVYVKSGGRWKLVAESRTSY